MSFKYINPGYANLLDVEGGVTVTDATKSKTGVGFYQPMAGHGINLSETPTELYGKFDVFLLHEGGSASYDFEVRVRIGGANGIGIKRYSNVWYLTGYCNTYAQVSRSANPYYPDTLKSETGLVPNAINTIYFHSTPKVGDDNGNLSIWVNGTRIADYNYAISFGASTTIEVYGTYASNIISNLILSDTEIHQREQVVILPVSTTETTMTANLDGTYTASAANQQILQGIDTTSLIADYGADSDIKGIAVIGNPAYRTAEGLAYLTGLDKHNDTVTQYGTKEVGTLTTGGAIDSRTVSMKLSDLTGYKFGWKAGVGS